MFDCLKGHISCFHTFFTILSSIPTSTKSLKIKHFTTFNTIKNHYYSTLKSPQSLENKTFSRTQPKITYLIRKFHLTNHIKSNLKISQTPVKSTLLLSNTNQNFTLLSKSKNLSHHKSHNEYNQKNTIISHSNREYINIAINNQLQTEIFKLKRR